MKKARTWSCCGAAATARWLIVGAMLAGLLASARAEDPPVPIGALPLAGGPTTPAARFADDLLSEAKRHAREIQKDGGTRDFAYWHIARLETQLRRYPDAVATVEQMNNPTKKALALTEIASNGAPSISKALAQRAFAEAIKSAERITGSPSKAIYLGRIGAAAAEFGDFDDARSVFTKATLAASASDSAEIKRDVLIKFVTAEAEAGSAAKAKAMIQDMTDAGQRVAALADIAAGQFRAGDRVGAKQTMDAAKLALGQLGEEVDRQAPIEATADAQAAMGDLVGATNTAATMMNSLARGETLSSVIIARAAAGDIDGATRAALAMSGAGDDADYRGLALFNIAYNQADAGNVAGAQKTEGVIADAWYKACALACIAGAEANAGKWAEAKRTVDSITDIHAKDDALAQVVAAQSRAGDVAGAKLTSQGFDAEYRKSEALADIAAGEARSGSFTEARATLDVAFNARKLPFDEGWKVEMLLRCARNILGIRHPAASGFKT